MRLAGLQGWMLLTEGGVCGVLAVLLIGAVCAVSPPVAQPVPVQALAAAACKLCRAARPWHVWSSVLALAHVHTSTSPPTHIDTHPLAHLRTSTHIH